MINTNVLQKEDVEHHEKSLPAKVGLWQKMGGGSLSIAIILHVILLLVGAVWIFQIIRQPEKQVDFLPGGGGSGGERGAQTKVQQKKQNQIAPSTKVKRVFSEGSVATYAIPEQGESFGEMSPLSSLGGGGMLGGGGGGALGNGSGFGTGIGGSGLGTSGGTGIFTPFGISGDLPGLKGHYYDLKFKKDGKQITSRYEIPELCKFYHKFFKTNWNERNFEKYLRAPQELTASQIAIPTIPAEKAPTYFGAKETQFPAWCVHYKGAVIAPESGTFRFVATSDDALAVRFNRKQVLTTHYCQGPVSFDNRIVELLPKEYLPKAFIRHSKNYPACQGNLACGEWFDVRQGSSYLCEILVMETGYGGANSAVLLMQKKGEEDKPLRLFRCTGQTLDLEALKKIGNAFNIPDCDLESPIWKSTKGWQSDI